MRSSRFLFLLIITQCYLISTEADINSLEGTVHDSPNHRPSLDVNALSQSDEWISNDGARFIRDTNEFTLTDQDDLSQLTTDELKINLDHAQTNVNEKTAEESKIQGELDTARTASQAANTTLAKAELDWKAALAEMNRLAEPFKEQKQDRDNKSNQLRDMKDVLSELKWLVSFPPNTPDENAYALNASNFAQQALPSLRARIKELEDIIPQLEKARDGKYYYAEEKNKSLDIWQWKQKKDGCLEQKADKESKEAEKPKRQAIDCPDTLRWVQNKTKDSEKAELELKEARDALREARVELRKKTKLVTNLQEEIQNWQDYVVALRNISLAAEAHKEADNRYKEPIELSSARIHEYELSKKLKKAKETAPRLAAAFSILEAQFESAKANRTKAEQIHSHYQAMYEERTAKSDDTAGPPLGLIAGCIVGALVVACAGAALYFLWWKKRKTTGNKDDRRDEDDKEGSKEGGKKEKVKSEKTKSDKAKSDEAQKSDEKKDEKEKTKPESPDRSKPDDPGVKVTCGMKSHGNNEVKEDAKDDNDTDKSNEGSKGGKKEKVKSEKKKSDEQQKSGEKKDEEEKSRPELLEKSKPDVPVVKVACGMKSHGKADEVITKTLRERKIDNEYTSNGLEAEEPIVSEKKAFTKTLDLLGNPQDDDATMDAGLEWEQLAKYVAKSQSKMDPAEIHRQVLHFLGSMDFHKINDLLSRNKDYRIPSIELDANGQIGYTITGRCDTIKTEDDMEGYHNHHANEKSLFNDGMLIRGY